MVATISADIVSSTSLNTSELIGLRRRLQELFERIAENEKNAFYKGWGYVQL